MNCGDIPVTTRKQTNKQTDRQTDSDENITSLAKVKIFNTDTMYI